MSEEKLEVDKGWIQEIVLGKQEKECKKLAIDVDKFNKESKLLLTKRKNNSRNKETQTFQTLVLDSLNLTSSTITKGHHQEKENLAETNQSS